MGEVKYLQPENQEELQNCLMQMTDKSVILGGGTDLIIKIRDRKPEIDLYVSICKVKEMQGITEEEGYIRIGAMATHSEIAANPLVQKHLQALSMACDHVGSKQIRNKGTIGGNIANASVAGDMLPCLYLFDAQIQVLQPDGQIRYIKATKYGGQDEQDKLGKKEAIMAIMFPVCTRKSCFVKLGPRKEVTIAEISLAMLWEEKDGKYENVRGVLGAVDVKPLLLQEAEEIFGGTCITKTETDRFVQSLSDRIKQIRERRKRQPKLRIHEWERVYKERAVKGVVYDVIQLMKPNEDVSVW